MKFAQELDQDAVPEWKAKYLNYRLAKKKLKTVTHALREFNRTPSTTGFRTPSYNPPISTIKISNNQQAQADENDSDDDIAPESDNRHTVGINAGQKSSQSKVLSPPQPEREPLVRKNRSEVAPLTRYGSIIGSPPKEPADIQTYRPPSLTLPEPAIRSGTSPKKAKKSVKIRDDEPVGIGASAYEAGETRSPASNGAMARVGSIFQGRNGHFNRSPLRRLMSVGQRSHPPNVLPDYHMDIYRELESAQNNFFGYLDEELDKVEEFYKEKEDEATERLMVLRDQLHILRDRRLDDLFKERREGSRARRESTYSQVVNHLDSSDSDEPIMSKTISWLAPLDWAWETARNGRVGKKSVGMQAHGTPNAFRPLDDNRDYERRKKDTVIPYRTAKRKLKLAMQEFYRSLELLKSYSILNRTAFRKINKKYDKSTNSRPPLRYMSEKVNKAWFVKSDVIENHIKAVEDLYARYFEAGNHKIAANKLRKTVKVRDYHGGAMFRNGIYLSSGAVFGGLGIEGAYKLIHSNNPDIVAQTGYLLQIYGGYFLMLLLMLFFCLACQIWTRAKVNYVFIFEFDPRENLDWRQLLEIPSLCFLFLGFFVWLNFTRFGADDMYTYYPVLLIALTAMVLFLPLPIIYWKARVWFLESCWRLLWSGLFPVEFRDFFLGDMFCSTSYSMGNIELFFCLYAHHWVNPPICNSSHSRLLGFFSTLPAIWRALQCIRRFRDTHNFFPHLVNCGKYTCTILFYVSLSLYRINKTHQLFALFIFSGSLNSTYCSVWDLAMDWSLLDATAEKPFLRTMLAYKQTWIYYLAMVVDPILRFNWIFYAIYADDIQHSAVLSFLIGLSEIFRRGIWTIFRVENEHCTNVERFRASRDVPLPFESRDYTPAALESGALESEQQPSEELTTAVMASPQYERLAPVATGSDRSRPSPSLRFRRADSPLIRTLSVVGAAMHGAHVQDFERRKKNVMAVEPDPDSSDDEADEHLRLQSNIDEIDEGEERSNGQRSAP